MILLVLAWAGVISIGLLIIAMVVAAVITYRDIKRGDY